MRIHIHRDVLVHKTEKYSFRNQEKGLLQKIGLTADRDGFPPILVMHGSSSEGDTKKLLLTLADPSDGLLDSPRRAVAKPR